MNFVNLFLIFILLGSFTSVFAHGTEEAHSEEGVDTKSTMDIILPFSYLEEGNYGGAILVVVFWFLLLKGLWELTMLILGRAM